MGNYAVGFCTQENCVDELSVEARWSLLERCAPGSTKSFTLLCMAKGLIDVNPAADLDIVAEAPRPFRHNPFLQVSELPGLLRTFTHYECAEKTRLGCLLLLTGVRTGELRAATPDQFDLDNGIWRVH